MTFLEYHSKFGTEEKVINHFIKVRYEHGVSCPHCQSKKVYHRIDFQKLFICKTCNNHFSIFKGTIFEKSSTDLSKWFYAIHIFLNGKKGISGLQLQREIGGSYKTSWRILKQIRVAMKNKQSEIFFKDTIAEMDETYVGGKPRKMNKKEMEKKRKKKRKRGRGTSKTPVVGIVDRISKQVIAQVALPNSKSQKLTGKQLLAIIKQRCDTSTLLMTDQLTGYNVLDNPKNGYQRKKINHSVSFCEGDIHTNNIENFWSLMKRGIYGTYHSVSVKHLQSYVDEFVFRYNNINTDIFSVLIQNTILEKDE